MTPLLHTIGALLRRTARVLDPRSAARERQARRAVQEKWRRIARGDDLPEKVRAYLEEL